MSEVRLDFSEFHPLDHWPWSRRCLSLPGGAGRHLRLTWEYRRGPELRARTVCLVGIHRPRPYWRGRGGPFDPDQHHRRPADGHACIDCGKAMDR